MYKCPAQPPPPAAHPRALHGSRFLLIQHHLPQPTPYGSASSMYTDVTVCPEVQIIMLQLMATTTYSRACTWQPSQEASPAAQTGWPHLVPVPLQAPCCHHLSRPGRSLVGLWRLLGGLIVVDLIHQGGQCRDEGQVHTGLHIGIVALSIR